MKKIINFILNIDCRLVVKSTTAFLASLFVGIVVLERFPGVMTPTSIPNEALMFNLFKISLLDDITHFLSGIVGFLALYRGYKWSAYYLMLIGGYYFLDATFFVINGFLTGQSFLENISLNIPHIGISVLIAHALYRCIKKVELN